MWYVFTVAAQEGPGIVIAHSGQDVELLCTVTVTSGSQTTGWLVNNRPYRINALHNGILTGHSATSDSSNLIVENIMMNDVRNGSEYRCVTVPAQGMITVADIIEESDPTILYVAGEWYRHSNIFTMVLVYVIINCTSNASRKLVIVRGTAQHYYCFLPALQSAIVTTMRNT